MPGITDDEAARLLERVPDAVIFATPDGRIQYWNAAAERVFGHSAAEAVGQSVDLIVPEQFRERHWTGFDQALEARATKYEGQALPTRSMRADGATIYVELGFAMVLDDSGEVMGVLATARDITERFEREREARRRLRELEAALAEVESGGQAPGG